MDRVDTNTHHDQKSTIRESKHNDMFAHGQDK